MSSDSPLTADFPVTPGAFQTTNTQDNGVAFVAKLNAAGSALVYATYLGGAVAQHARHQAAMPPESLWIQRAMLMSAAKRIPTIFL